MHPLKKADGETVISAKKVMESVSPGRTKLNKTKSKNIKRPSKQKAKLCIVRLQPPEVPGGIGSNLNFCVFNFLLVTT